MTTKPIQSTLYLFLLAIACAMYSPKVYSANKIHTLVDKNDHLSMLLKFEKDSTLSIKVTYTIKNFKGKHAYFALDPGYKVNSITAKGLKDFKLDMKANRPFPFYKLNFESTKENDEILQVNFEYTIDLKTTNHIADNWIELNVDKLWFPHYKDLDHKFTWDVAIENLYKNYSIVTYEYDEIIRYKTLMDSKSLVKIKHENPTAEIYLIMAKDMKLWKDVNGNKSNIQFFAHKNTSKSLIASMNDKVEHLINFFNKKFGQSNPIENYLMVLRNTNDIGFLQSRGEILLANQDSDSYADLAHEVAHYWWANADFINEPWMNESFANYSMFLALDEFDKQALSQQLKRSEKYLKTGASVKDAKTFPGSDFNVFYHKGSMLLWKLEKEIGREALLMLLSKRVKNKIDSTGGFLEVLEEQEDFQTRNLFENWLNKNHDIPKVSLFGTFHFAGSTTDLAAMSLKDPYGEKRQSEIKALVEHLKAFKPTKILVEYPKDRDDELNIRYNNYLSGKDTLQLSETYQVGFRLAKQLNHKKLYAIDHKLDLPMNDMMLHIQKAGKMGDFNKFLNSIRNMISNENIKLANVTITEYLAYMNTDNVDQLANEVYLKDILEFNDETSDAGSKVSATWWRRNMLILNNIAETIETKKDRILVIIGAAHRAVIKDFIEDRSDLEYIEIGDYLKN